MTTYERGTVASITGQVYEARRHEDGRVEINLAEWTPVGDWIEVPVLAHLFEPGPEPYGMCTHPDPHTIEQAHECDALAHEEREDVTGEREES